MSFSTRNQLEKQKLLPAPLWAKKKNRQFNAKQNLNVQQSYEKMLNSTRNQRKLKLEQRYFSPIRLSKLKRSSMSSVAESVRKWEPSDATRSVN